MEIFSEKSVLNTGSSKEIAGLLKKKKKKNMMTQSREIAYVRILACLTEGTSWASV